MNLKNTHFSIFLVLTTIISSISLNAQNYIDKEMQYIIQFFDESNNWEIAGLYNPIAYSSEEKMNFLVNHGIIAVDNNGYVQKIELDKPYSATLELVDFEKLTRLEVKRTYISSFFISNSPLINIHLESNRFIESVEIEDCSSLEKILITPDPNLDETESMSLEEVRISNCQSLVELDLSGINDRPVIYYYFSSNINLRQLIIENCPSLTNINCVNSEISSIETDTPENIKRINAWQAYMLNDFSSFVNLEELTCEIDCILLENLPTSLRTLILPGKQMTYNLDISHLTSLEELDVYGNNLHTLITPSSLNPQISDFRYNRFSNETLKELVGDITNEMIADHKIFPQKLNRFEKIYGLIEYTEVAEVGKDIDLSAETYEGVGSSFKWYKISDDAHLQLRNHNLYTDGFYYPVIEEFKQTGKLELKSEEPIFNAGADLNLQHVLCVVEPEGYNKWNEIDPRRYYLYQIAPFPELKYQIEIDGKVTDLTNGGSIQIDEGSQVILFVVCDIQNNPLSYHGWDVYGSIDDGANIRFEMLSRWESKIDLSSLTKGKHEIKIKYATFDNVQMTYSKKDYNENITIQIGKEDPDPDAPPTLQYKVKIDNGSYNNVRTRGTTTEYEGTNVYLGIMPKPSTGNIEYDEWKITFTGPDQKQISTETKTADTLYEFNPDNPHSNTGDYHYTTTRLHLYKNGQEVDKSPFYVDDPYTISIIKNDNPIPDDIHLQYRVKVNEGIYMDVPTGGTTIEHEGTDVYLGIVPVNNSSIKYDEWRIRYNSPSAIMQSSENIAADDMYEFNPQSPHSTTGEYPYLTYRLHLYQNGNEIEGSPYLVNDPYTIIITKTLEAPIIEMDTLWTVCPGEQALKIPFKLLSMGENPENKIIFCEKPEECYFEEMEEYRPMPAEGYFTINISQTIPPGSYQGDISIRYANIPDQSYNYRVYIHIPETVIITKQPQPVSNLCVSDTFSLSIEASGSVLAYQWYHNSNPINGATNPIYKTIYDKTAEGEYFVELTDSCGIIYSDTILVTGSNVWIEQKWDDVLYVYNKEGIYTSYQWYKNGNKIQTYGTSQYYPEAGMSGTYTVRAYRADGSYDESCPFITIKETKAGLPLVYPNPVKRYSQMTVTPSQQGEYFVRIINLAGHPVYSTRRSEQETQIDITFPSGVYIVIIQLEDGKQYTEKVIVIE